MRRVWIAFGIAVLLLVGGLIWLLGTRQPPSLIPDDPEHRAARGEDSCLTCHAGDGPAPRSKNHPLSQRCFQCHVRE